MLPFRTIFMLLSVTKFCTAPPSKFTFLTFHSPSVIINLSAVLEYLLDFNILQHFSSLERPPLLFVEQKPSATTDSITILWEQQALRTKMTTLHSMRPESSA